MPEQLREITTVGAEVPPEELGLAPGAAEAIWAAAQRLYRTGYFPGVSLVVRVQGQPLVQRALGHRRFGGGDLMTVDTPACSYSGSKAITAVVLHKLVVEGVFGLDDRVVDYFPEFGANGKGATTIRGLLTHRAGIATVPLPAGDTSTLFDWERMLELLCAAPLHMPGRQAYHALTAGYILGEVAERASGESISELLRTRLAEPLGSNLLTYGVPAHRRPDVATSYWRGPRIVPPLTNILTRMVGGPVDHVVPLMESGPGLDAVLPAGNMFASANDLADVFQMLVDGGRWRGKEIIPPEAIAAAVEPAGPRVIDRTLWVPSRMSAGFMLGYRGTSIFGRDAVHAFGHLGMSHNLCWADPDRDLVAVLLTTGKTVVPWTLDKHVGVSGAITRATTRPA